MASVLRISLVDPVTQDRQELKRLLADLDPVWVQAECSRYDELPELVEQTGPDVVVVGIDANTEEALNAIRLASQLGPNTKIFVVSRDSDSQRILQAMRAGASEYLTIPIKIEDLLGALDRCRRAVQQEGSSTSGAVVAITGSSGGVGSTCIAVSLACWLAGQPDTRVVLADLDLALGDADVCLDLIHNYTLLDVVENIDRLDFTLLKRSMVQHSSGLLFLPHPTDLTDACRIHPRSISRLIGLLRATFTHVVLDLSNAFRETDLAAMAAADTVLLIAQLNVSSLRNVARVFKALETIDGMAEKVKVVLNRTGARDQSISVERAEATIGREIFWHIPNDWLRVNEARNNGVPVILHAPKCRAAVAIAGLGEKLFGRSEQGGNGASSEHKRSWLALFK